MRQGYCKFSNWPPVLGRWAVAAERLTCFPVHHRLRHLRVVTVFPHQLCVLHLGYPRNQWDVEKKGLLLISIVAWMSSIELGE